MTDKDLKGIWDSEYSDDDRVSDITGAGEDITPLQGREIRNWWMAKDFTLHVSTRPKPIMVEVLTNAKSLLEVGAGTGEFSYQLLHDEATKFTTVHMLDVSLTALKRAAAKFEDGLWKLKDDQEIHFIEGDFFDMQLNQGSFDLILASQVVEHFANPDILINKMKLN